MKIKTAENMPIKKENRNLYPANWPAISRHRRQEVAKNRCEFCGAENRKPHFKTGSLVTLTVAHLDHNPQNNKEENLRALCNQCHHLHDGKHHAETRKASKLKEQQRGQLKLKFKPDNLNSIL